MVTTEVASSIIALWGAGLSTALALIKVWEVWSDRFQIDISYDFHANEEVGNKILIRNLTARPLILTYWEVLYRSARGPFRKYEFLALPHLGAMDIRLEHHSTHSLDFSGEHYFDWGASSLKGRTIFVRLHIAGRRAILRRVYPG